MPSPRHDALNALFQNNPALAVELLRDHLGVDLPTDVPVTLDKSTFNNRPSNDFHADTVVTVGPPHAPIHGIIVEIQLRKTIEKRRQLPRYAAAKWLELDRPVTVLVVCPDRKAAAWYAEPIPTTLPGYVFQAVVLGPDGIPAIADPHQAATHPELAALAVMAHGHNRKVAEAFLSGLFAEGIRKLSAEHAEYYYNYARSIAAPAVQRILEEIMSMSSTWPVYSPLAREHFGRGEAKGRAEEAAKTILLVLSARSLTVSDQARRRITSCDDLELLESWVRRAATAETTDDLFR